MESMQLKPVAATIILFITIIGTGLSAQDSLAIRKGLEFEAATVRRHKSAADSIQFPPASNGQFTVANVSLKVLISYAFNVQVSDISGDPAWVSSDKYDVTAKPAKANLSLEHYRLMVQSLLANRFKLAAHREMTVRKGWVLLRAKEKPRLAQSNARSCVERGTSRDPGKLDAVTCGTFSAGPSSLDTKKMSMAQFTNTLATVLGVPVFDKTGISGRFDIHLEFNPEGTNLTGSGALPPDAVPDDNRRRPSLLTAIQQQVGLRLESGKVLASVLVIDHVEPMPPEN